MEASPLQLLTHMYAWHSSSFEHVATTVTRQSVFQSYFSGFMTFTLLAFGSKIVTNCFKVVWDTLQYFQG